MNFHNFWTCPNPPRTQMYTLAIKVVRSARLAAAQRRSARLLPGGGDTTTAACYVLGGLPDRSMRTLLRNASPAAPREARLKHVERALKERVRSHIVSLNGANARDLRACNLAAVRICSTAADILGAHAARCLVDDLAKAEEQARRKDATIAALKAELAALAACDAACQSQQAQAPQQAAPPDDAAPAPNSGATAPPPTPAPAPAPVAAAAQH